MMSDRVRHALRGVGGFGSSFRRSVPLIDQLRAYSRKALAADGGAALAVAATLIPQGLAYGEVAGLAPATGLYTAAAAGLVFALFTSTRFVVVGPSSALAAMTFEAVHGASGGNADKASALAACLAILVGLVCIVSPLLRMSRIAEFLSGPVMLGYLAGTGAVIFVGQIGPLLGLPVTGERLTSKVWSIVAHLGQVHPATAAVGLGALTALLLLKRYKLPLSRSLIVLVGAIVASAMLNLSGKGVAVIGAITGGIPIPTLPAVTPAEVWAIAPSATGIALVAVIETLSAARKGGNPQQRSPTSSRDSFALGAANIAAGLFGGFGADGSATRSQTAHDAGARSQLFQIAAVALILLTLFLGGRMVGLLPHAALAAALIAVSVPKLIDFAGFRRLWQGWRTEALLALFTMFTVVGLGVLHGLLIAVLLAAAQLFQRAAHPHDAVLAVTSPNEPACEVNENDIPRSPVLIYRVDAPLFFGNVGRVTDHVRALAAGCGPELRYLIFDAESIFYLDATAAEALAQLTADLQQAGCRILLARTRQPVLTLLRRNPYHGGATSDLPDFRSVRQAHDYAHENLKNTLTEPPARRPPDVPHTEPKNQEEHELNDDGVA